MLGFSSTERTNAFCGGFRYKPTMSAALAVNSGSVLTHQLRCLAKHTPSFRSTRQTACTDVFKCFARAGPTADDPAVPLLPLLQTAAANQSRCSVVPSNSQPPC